MKFVKRLINGEPYEAASAFDVNNDGIVDIVCGGRWFEGPDLTRIHTMYDVPPVQDGQYRDEFSCCPMDVNGDGWTDVITASWWDNGVYWRENPGEKGGEWPLHKICTCTEVEALLFFDIDGCGTPEIFPNTPNEAPFFLKWHAGDVFTRHTLGSRISGHGLGFGDINGDGRPDIILTDGWLEQPEDLYLDTWRFHPEFHLGLASVPILAMDVTGNGKTDIISGNGHDYGLYWYEQIVDMNGRRSWIPHEIETSLSQYHNPQLADLDGDGIPELIAGTRWRAHNGNDPGEHNPIGLYVFHVDGGRFTPTRLDLGDPETASGLGICAWIQDVTGNGYPDIIAPGKEGLYLFENRPE